MPNECFYIRNHFPVPTLDQKMWHLRVGGLVKRPLSLSLQELVDLPSRSMLVTLECAGNGRAKLKPSVEGEQWDLGAVSTAEWTGVSLSEVLRRAGVDAGAQEVLFRGADGGEVEPAAQRIRFERSLSLADAHASGVLLAYAMNGQQLAPEHGFPLRAIVPGWYAVASVKWLTELELIGHQFSGYYQTHKYLYEWTRDGRTVTEPVRHQRVRALITHPGHGDVIETGRLTVRGVAWSGLAPIAHVEIRLNRDAWQPARLLGRPHRYCWEWWELITAVEEPGPVTIQARATDAIGRTQPKQIEWNRHGYGNNAIQSVTVRAS